jgi:hypothetical protein
MTKKSRGRGRAFENWGIEVQSTPSNKQRLPSRARPSQQRTSTTSPSRSPATVHAPKPPDDQTPSTPKPSSAPAPPSNSPNKPPIANCCSDWLPHSCHTTPCPPWTPCSIASRPFPKRAGTSGSLGWRRKGLPWNHLPSRWRSRWCWWRARPGGSIHLIMLRTVGGRRDGRCACMGKGSYGAIGGMVGCGWWGVVGGSVGERGTLDGGVVGSVRVCGGGFGVVVGGG